jgi:hypothetical protein
MYCCTPSTPPKRAHTVADAAIIFNFNFIRVT